MEYSMPCRDINSLLPIAKQACQLFLIECEKKGLKVGISQTLRTADYQYSLYQQGRTVKGKIVTNCDGYKIKSPHQSGFAWDFYRNDGKNAYDDSDGFFLKVATIARDLGMDAGYFWTGFQDTPHIQVHKNWQAPKKEDDEMVAKAKIEINGVIKEVDVIVKDGVNYVKLRDIADSKIEVGYDASKKMPKVTSK